VIRELALLWQRFSPMERRVFSEIRGVLPDAATPMFDGQLGAITRVQRLPPSWSEIDFYSLRRGKPNWTGVPLFPCTDEFRLAEVRFRVLGRSYKSTLASVGGHIFDLTTAPGARKVAFVPWDGEPKTRLLGDPLRAPTGRKERESLPRDWQDFLGRHSGAPARGWAFHDEETSYRVTLVDGVYLLLAECEGEAFILHRVEPPGTRLFYVRGHDANPEEIVGDIEEIVGAAQQ